MSAHLKTVSTDSVEPSDRLELWETYNSQELVGLRCSTYHPEGLRATQVNLDLGGVRVASINGNAHVVDRSMQEARNAPKDSIFVGILREGSGIFHDASGTRSIRVGDALIYDAGRPHLFAFDTDMRLHMLDIPRELLGTVPSQPLVIHRGSDLTAAGVRVLGDRIGELLSSSVDAATTREELLALTSSLFPHTEPTTTTLRRAAKTWISDRLNDPELTAETVARAVGVSLRHLNRGFADENTTVTQYIHDQRLELAKQELTSITFPPSRIADIAAHWGFSSQAHFTRAFRRQYGVAPSEMRAAALTASTPPLRLARTHKH